MTIRTIGRGAAVISILGCAAMFLLLFPQLRHALEQPGALRSVYDLIGALTAMTLFATWLTAILHWGIRYSPDRGKKWQWGLVVVFGAFVGAWVYWLSSASSATEWVGSAKP